MALAIFDLDETLIASDSDYAWGEYCARSGLVDPNEHRRRNNVFYQQYKRGELDADEYFAFSCSVLAGHPLPVLHEHRRRFISEHIEALILPKAKELVAEHKRAGDHVMVITATIEFVTRPIVDIFEIETLIAPVPELLDNAYTGRLRGIPSFGEGKVHRLMAWLDGSGYSLDGSYFYSDSHNDLPLLRLVDNPVAVDPDDRLAAEAREKQWQIISLR